MWNSYLIIKIVSGAAKEMVTSELSKRLASNVASAGGKMILATAQAGASLIIKHNTNTITAAQGKSGSPSNEDPDKNPQSTEYLVKHWLEDLFARFQMIVLWHEPHVSIAAIFGILTSFIMVTYLAPTFYATFMIALLIHNLTKVWFRHIWPEIRVPPGESRELQDKLDLDRFTHLDPQLMSLDEFCDHVNCYRKSCDHIWQQLFDLRRDRPILFCFLVCSILTCTATIGNLISGLSLIFATLIALIIIPGVYIYLIPADLKAYLACQLVLLLKLILHFRDVAFVDDDYDTDDESENDEANDHRDGGDDESKELISIEEQPNQAKLAILPKPSRSSMVSKFTGLFYDHNQAEKTTNTKSDETCPPKDRVEASQILYPKLEADLPSKHLAESEGEEMLQLEDEEDCEGFVIL